jgi:hypothetical protein
MIWTCWKPVINGAYYKYFYKLYCVLITTNS